MLITGLGKYTLNINLDNTQRSQRNYEFKKNIMFIISSSKWGEMKLSCKDIYQAHK